MIKFQAGPSVPPFLKDNLICVLRCYYMLEDGFKDLLPFIFTRLRFLVFVQGLSLFIHVSLNPIILTYRILVEISHSIFLLLLVRTTPVKISHLILSCAKYRL